LVNHKECAQKVAHAPEILLRLVPTKYGVH
jgi:hypothetical protein